MGLISSAAPLVIDRVKIYIYFAIAAVLLVVGIGLGVKMGYSSGFSAGETSKEKEITAQIDAQNEALKQKLAKEKEETETLLGKLNVATADLAKTSAENAKLRAKIPKEYIPPRSPKEPTNDLTPSPRPLPDFIITTGFAWVWNRSLHNQGSTSGDTESIFGTYERASGLDRRTQTTLNQEALLSNVADNASSCQNDRTRFKSLQIQICRLGLHDDKSPCPSILDPKNEQYSHLQ